jgi:hypothetical protein
LCLWPFFGILCRTLSEKMKRKMRIQHMSPCFFMYWAFHAESDDWFHLYRYIYIICMYWK